MAYRNQSRSSIPALVALVSTVSLTATSPQIAQAHQLVNPNGSVAPHQHVYKRSGYGNNYITGHVAPTRHGHNMIIWSPAPTNSYGNSVPRMHIQKPGRHSRLNRTQQAGQTKQNLRDLQRRDGRR